MFCLSVVIIIGQKHKAHLNVIIFIRNKFVLVWQLKQSPQCGSFTRNSNKTKIVLSGCYEKLVTRRILGFESFVVSVKGTAGASKKLSVLMTDTKRHVGRVASAPAATFSLRCCRTAGTGAVDYLGHCDATLLCQLLFSLLAGIGVTEVRVEILV